MEKAAVELLQKTANIPEVLAAAKSVTSDSPMIVLPEGYRLTDLESSMPYRRSYRGTFSTDSVPDYIEYIKMFDVDGSKCFISSTSMSAKTIFDMGDVAKPGHQEHEARLVMAKTSAYEAILDLNGNRLDQKDLAEWIEDWRDFIKAEDTTGAAMTASAAAQAVRKITIEATRKMESEVGDFSEHMSELEKIEASSSMAMPAWLYFTCKPYNDLSEVQFGLRISIMTGGDKPAFRVRITQLESIKEEITAEFKELIIDKLKAEGCKTATFIGNV